MSGPGSVVIYYSVDLEQKKCRLFLFVCVCLDVVDVFELNSELTPPHKEFTSIGLCANPFYVRLGHLNLQQFDGLNSLSIMSITAA